jgi:hypothetical protein
MTLCYGGVADVSETLAINFSNTKQLIKNVWSFTPTSPIRLHCVVLKCRASFTFTQRVSSEEEYRKVLYYGVTVRGSIQVSLFITIVSALAPNQPTTKWVAGALIPGIERSEREADCSPLLNVMVKTEWSISSVLDKTGLRILLDH